MFVLPPVWRHQGASEEMMDCGLVEWDFLFLGLWWVVVDEWGAYDRGLQLLHGVRIWYSLQDTSELVVALLVYPVEKTSSPLTYLFWHGRIRSVVHHSDVLSYLSDDFRSLPYNFKCSEFVFGLLSDVTWLLLLILTPI